MSLFVDCRLIRFYRVDKGRNKGIVLVFGAFPARILKHRGWNNPIYQRLMVQAEIDMVQQCRRLVSYRYEDIESLLIDELNTLGNGKDFEVESRVLCGLYETTLEAVFKHAEQCSD
jgi:hypothetical protein